jgi:hypothetical protein
MSLQRGASLVERLSAVNCRIGKLRVLRNVHCKAPMECESSRQRLYDARPFRPQPSYRTRP